MASPRLIVLCGLPFAGKSVLGRRLAATTGAVLVAYDDLWRERKDATGLSLGYEELRALAEARLRAALTAGHDTVFDTLNDTRDARERLRRLAEGTGAEAVIVYLETSPRTRCARRRRSRITGDRHDVPSDRLAAAARKFSPPTDDEAPMRVLPRTPLREILAGLFPDRVRGNEAQHRGHCPPFAGRMVG